MWTQLEKHLPEFANAVLSGLDPAGDPYGVRCWPVLEPGQQRLRLPLAPTLPLQPGPACLLCHTHDEHLWNLKSFVVRGTLEGDDLDWVLIPRQFIPGMGIGGWRSYMHFVRHGRAATRAYFAQRGQPYPVVRWDQLMALLTGQGEQVR
ncbi:MAG: hypothetical protein ABI847_18310 [Anaerolineales bacterium]